jgi:hypothetical protein
MVLAELASRDLHPGHPRWPHISGWAAELGLTAPDAIAQASQPPPDATRQPEPPGPRTGRLEPDLDREAAD